MPGAARDPKPNRQIRSLVLYVDLVGSRRIWLLMSEASSVWSEPDGSRRIVWMIKQMIKSLRQESEARQALYWASGIGSPCSCSAVSTVHDQIGSIEGRRGTRTSSDQGAA
jgi:hypothetical protein